MGVLELDQDDRARDFSPTSKPWGSIWAIRLAWPCGCWIRRSVQEQLSRTEKLAAVGRLISSVVNELETPLASIQELAGQARERVRQAPGEREVAAIAAEAQKASAVVARLVTFASSEQVEARPVAVGDLLRQPDRFPRRRLEGFRHPGARPGFPRAAQGAGLARTIGAGVSESAGACRAGAGRRARKDASPFAPACSASGCWWRFRSRRRRKWRNAEETAAVLGVTHSVVAGHGGEVRLIEKADEEPRFEVELPLAGRERSAAAARRCRTPEIPRRLTALVIEPDEASAPIGGHVRAERRACDTGRQRRHSARTGARARIDAAFCSVHAPGLNWVELSERMRPAWARSF